MAEQQNEFLDDKRKELSGGPLASAEFDAGGERYLLRKGGAADPQVRKNRLTLVAPSGAEPVRLLQLDGQDRVVREFEARELRMRCAPDRTDKRMHVDIVMIDCVVSDGGERTARPTFPRQFSVAMPPELVALESRAPGFYLGSEDVSAGRQQRLLRDVLKIGNGIVSELNARASFGVSCFILVMVGCALGMMFRSGNFLSAFAVSVVPALLSIALVVTGQHTCENIPWNLTPGQWNNPLHMGVLIIWSGNIAVLAIAVVLLWRLQRQ